MAKKNIALIGCGYWGRNHLRTLSSMKNVNLSYVCDPRMSDIDLENSETELTADYQKILDDSSVRGVVISTPTATHYSLAKEFLNVKKAVFVEKPLATSVNDAEDLCSIAKSIGQLLMVGEIFRFNPAVHFIKNLIESGEIGELRYLESRRVGLGPVRNDVSALWDLATHDIYISNLLVGRNPIMLNYSGVSHNGKLDDISCINIKYSKPSVLSTIYVNWEHPIKERVLIVGGTKKAVKFDDVQPSEKIAIFERGVDYSPVSGDFGEFQSSIRSGSIIIPQIKIKQPLEEELKNFIESIDCPEKCMSPGHFGLQTVKVLEAAEESRGNRGVEILLK